MKKITWAEGKIFYNNSSPVVLLAPINEIDKTIIIISKEKTLLIISLSVRDYFYHRC